MKDILREKALLYRINANQSRDAFSELYKRYEDALFRFVMLKVPSREIAEDVTAEVFVQLWVYVHERRRITHFRGLAYRIARSCIAQYYKSPEYQKIIYMENLPEDLLSTTVTVGGHTVTTEQLVNALGQIGESNAELIMLRYVEELRVKDIAVIVDKRPKSVSIALYRARKALKHLLDKELSTK